MLPSAKSLALFQNDSKSKEDKSESELPIPRRTFADERNQFVIHLYFPLGDNETVSSIYTEFANQSPNVVFVPQPHISFIRGHYAIQYHQIDPLLLQLTTVIETFSRFSLCLSNIEIFDNEEKTRHFIAIGDSQPDNFGLANSAKAQSRQLIHSIHQVLKQFHSEVFVVDEDKLDSFIFHTSVAWFLPEDGEIGRRICADLEDYFSDSVILAKIDRIHVKIGHRSAVINLN